MFWWLCTGVLILGAVAGILLPVLRTPSPWAIADLHGVRRLLLREKERVLRLIKDLDAEHERQAIDPQEYERLRRAYLLEAARIQRQLDGESSQAPATPSSTAPSSATQASATQASATQASATQASATQASATQASATQASATQASVMEGSTQEESA